MKSHASLQIKPVKKEDRILYLDILRGIAVFFILIANIYFFCGWMFFSEDMKADLQIIGSTGLSNTLPVYWSPENFTPFFLSFSELVL